MGVSCLGGNTTLCKHRSELNVDIIYIPIKIYVGFMVCTYVCMRLYLCPLDWSLFRALMH